MPTVALAKKRPAAASTPAARSTLSSIKPAATVDSSMAGAAGCPCGGGCPDCSKRRLIQPALMVGPADDVYEREAERIATAMTAGAADGPPAAGKNEPANPASSAPSAQRQAGAIGAAATDNVTEEAARQLGGGRPLDAASRDFFESHLGHDLGRVRVHTDRAAARSADELGARAYTMGRDVVFGAGEYDPATASGRHLLAHELVHVVQQGAATPHSVAAPNPKPPPALAPAAYSLRLVTENGEKWIMPPVPEAGEGAVSKAASTPSPQPPAPKAAAEETPPQNVPVQRMPKNSSAPAGWIQRTATFTKPTPAPQDPLARLAQGLTPGLTTPKINGTKSPSGSQLLAALSPTNVGPGGGGGGKVSCQFANFNIDTSAEQIVASAAPAGGWAGNVPPDKLDNPVQCAKVAKVPVTMNAQPNNADFVKRVQASEDEHVADLKALHDQYLVPLDKFVNGLTSTGPDLQTCANNLVGQLNHRSTEAAFAFSNGWAASVSKLDGPGGTHNDTAVVKAAKDCSSATITLSQTNPRIAGSAPGNVATIAPTVTNFDPKKLKVSGNNLTDGKTVVKTFSSAGGAVAALAVIQRYGMTSRNVIGPMEYFLAGGAAPSGALKAANELAIDPARYQVTIDVPNAGDWAITEAIGIAAGVNVNVLVNFGAKRDEAYSALAVLKAFNFTQQGWVGGTRQKPEMMYFRT